jgi:hypothetical protein
MKAEIYLAFYDNSKGLGWWRTLLIKSSTFSRVNHVGIIFDLPFSSLSPMVVDGERCRLITEYMLEKRGAKLLYKKFMGTKEICLEQIKHITDTQKISTWYKVLLWYLVGRWLGFKVNHCGTLAQNWLNKNLGYNYKMGHIPHRFLEEVRNDYSYYRR